MTRNDVIMLGHVMSVLYIKLSFNKFAVMLLPFGDFIFTLFSPVNIK